VQIEKHLGDVRQDKLGRCIVIPFETRRREMWNQGKAAADLGGHSNFNASNGQKYEHAWSGVTQGGGFRSEGGNKNERTWCKK
jgi:hypothetical protein